MRRMTTNKIKSHVLAAMARNDTTVISLALGVITDEQKKTLQKTFVINPEPFGYIQFSLKDKT